jgi:phage tail sheath protein FI
MPVSPTYPGVYIEEIPSGVRTITGVATSITAFLGRAIRGPVNEPVTINSYADFERVFGGLWVESRLGFAVRDFFSNGGGQAVIVRLFRNGGSPGKAQVDAFGLVLEAATEGTWGNQLRVRIDRDVLEATADRLGVLPDDLFNLTVRDGTTGELEHFPNLTPVPGPRFVTEVLADSSRLVRVLDVPAPEPFREVSGHGDPAQGETIWTDENASTPVDAINGTDGFILTGTELTGSRADKTGLYALEKTDLFNLLCIPPYLADGNIDSGLISEAAAYCAERRAMLIIDPPTDWTTKDAAKDGIKGVVTSKSAALFFPRIVKPNPLAENRLEEFAPCGVVAGVIARTDASRGVWKAPAGLDATLNGVPRLSVSLTDQETGELNPLGINCLRVRPATGPVIWGARTRQGDDRLDSEWRYISVRRLALYIEESLYRGTQWAVFEPNDESLWAQLRLNTGAFMQTLFRQGAFQGQTPQEAYLVKVDKETTTQTDIDRGIVNMIVGFAPLKPAEFVIIKIQQLAGPRKE